MTEKEKKAANKFKRKLNAKVVLWVLSGSSVHKFWPFQDQVIARLLLQYPDVKNILVGDMASKILEQGWENEPRVKCMSGKWSVRETMAFCYFADVIVTPETGVALSVQFENIPKVLLLSHSSVSNYAEDWENCTPVEPSGCDCYPCHQLHYGFDYCSVVEATDGKDSARIAECQYRISADSVYEAITKNLNGDL
jgi:hypothetical protein